jgi:hypothetical protein
VEVGAVDPVPVLVAPPPRAAIRDLTNAVAAEPYSVSTQVRRGDDRGSESGRDRNRTGTTTADGADPFTLWSATRRTRAASWLHQRSISLASTLAPLPPQSSHMVASSLYDSR